MSNVLKSQGKSGPVWLIENQLPSRSAARPQAARPAAFGHRATPPGGLPRQEGLPLAVRPVSLLGDRS